MGMGSRAKRSAARASNETQDSSWSVQGPHSIALNLYDLPHSGLRRRDSGPKRKRRLAGARLHNQAGCPRARCEVLSVGLHGCILHSWAEEDHECSRDTNRRTDQIPAVGSDSLDAP